MVAGDKLFASCWAVKLPASLKSGLGQSGNGFTVLIPRVENQIDYHTYNSFTLKHLPKPGSLPRAAKATKLCESVKPFLGFKMTDLSDAQLAQRRSPCSCRKHESRAIRSGFCLKTKKSSLGLR